MAARDDNAGDKAGVNPAREALGEAMRDQKQRQDRLRHVQAFLTSPLFLDMRDEPLRVSDPPEAIEERKRDLDYRIAVLTSLVELLREERAQLDRTRSIHAPDSEPGPEPGPETAPDPAGDPSQA